MSVLINTNRLLSSHTYRALKRKLQQIRSFVQKKQLLRAQMLRSYHGASPTGSSPAARKVPLKVAVIGGWTDEDVYHICYELRTRFQGTELGTCSILTASPSMSQHWNALSQLKRVMNVTVSRTIKELIAWFGIGMLPYRLPGIPFKPRKNWPEFEWLGGVDSIQRISTSILTGRFSRISIVMHRESRSRRWSVVTRLPSC